MIAAANKNVILPTKYLMVISKMNSQHKIIEIVAIVHCIDIMEYITK